MKGQMEYPYFRGHVNSAGYLGYTPIGIIGHSHLPGFTGVIPTGAVGWADSMAFDGVIIEI